METSVVEICTKHRTLLRKGITCCSLAIQLNYPAPTPRNPFILACNQPSPGTSSQEPFLKQLQKENKSTLVSA
jgi:hypothetical protein